MCTPANGVLPDWTSITEDIFCPLCDYNLRGLAEPRCAECGYRFEWSDMLDPKRRHHPFLFEHHPKRKLWSFLRTVVATWRPATFWQQLHANQVIFTRRLSSYFAICLVPWLMISMTLIVYIGVVTYFQIMTIGAVLWRSGQVSEFTYEYYRWASGTLKTPLVFGTATSVDPLLLAFAIFGHHDNVRFWLIPTFLLVSWPLASFAALHAFALTMHKCRIKSAHVWRCVVYSGDVIFWLLMSMLVFLGLTLTGLSLFGGQPEDAIILMGILGHVAAWMVIPIGTWRLCKAYHYYLRFDRPVATVMLAQAIVVLLFLNLMAVHAWID